MLRNLRQDLKDFMTQVKDMIFLFFRIGVGEVSPTDWFASCVSRLLMTGWYNTILLKGSFRSNLSV